MPVLSINNAAMRDTKSWVTISEKTRGEISIYLQYHTDTLNIASSIVLEPLFDGIKITINLSWRILIKTLYCVLYARLYSYFISNDFE